MQSIWKQHKGSSSLWLLWISPFARRQSERALRFFTSAVHFKYSESFFKSSGIDGNGGHSCADPSRSATVFSARTFRSYTWILWVFSGVYPYNRESQP